MIMPGSPRISGEAFAIERLRESPDLDYASVRRMAEDAGIAMQPILYGRARKHLGLPPMKKAGPVLAASERALATADFAEAAPEMAVEMPADEPVEQPAAREAVPAAPRKKGSAAFDFLVGELRREPQISYGELRQRAEANGFPIAPIMYGRAKAVLGLVPVRPRGSKKAAAEAAANEMPAMPRMLKQVESVAADRFTKKLEEVRNLDQLVAAVKDLDAERRRLRTLLENIVTMIDEALG
jgi:hypothetical protein